MALSDRDRKILWSKAGNCCSFRHKSEICNQKIVISSSGDNIPIGQECHIYAKKDEGPRGDVLLPLEERDIYCNLIILCPNHHKIIDGQPDIFTSKLLKKMKDEHEQQVGKAAKSNNLIIEDFNLNVDAKDSDKVIGMEVNRPAELKGVKVDFKVQNVKEAIGFSTNQGMTIANLQCKKCNKSFSFVGTGQYEIVKCKFCGAEMPLH